MAEMQWLIGRLRALYQAEDSWVATISVGVAVIVFATMYTAVLLMLFTVSPLSSTPLYCDSLPLPAQCFARHFQAHLASDDNAHSLDL